MIEFDEQLGGTFAMQRNGGVSVPRSSRASFRGLADFFAEEAHPRAPAGSASGGQFVSADSSKGESGGKGASKDKQDQVKAVQKLLGLPQTGEFTAKDASALRHYQAVHGLKVDGVAGAQTVAALLGHGKKGPKALSAADKQQLLDVIRKPAKKPDAKAKHAQAAKQQAKKTTAKPTAKPAAKPPARPAQKPAPSGTAAKQAAIANRADTHPGDGNAERLHDYWVHGKGAAQIRWGEHGDFDRCVRLLGEHAHMSPDQAKGYCNLAHHSALGIYPATHAAMDKGHGRAQPVTTYTRSFALEDITVRSEGDGRTVDAYAAVFNTAAPVSDQDGQYEEVIDPAAFNRAIEHARRAKGGWNIPVMFNHGMTIFHTPSERHSVPIGIPLEIRADNRGLFTRTRYHNTPAADEVLEAIREGSITAYSFSGAFHRSDPMVPRGGFRRSGSGQLPTVRRTESSLREYGPATFPVYAGAEVVGVRAEQAALMLGSLTADERERLVSMFRSGTPLVSPEPGTSDDSELAAEDPPAWHSARPPKQIIQAARAAWIQRHGGAR